MKDEFAKDMHINFLSGHSNKATEMFNVPNAKEFEYLTDTPMMK